MLLQALRAISKPWVNSNWCYSPETPNLGQNRRFFVPHDLEIWRMTLKNNRALFYAASSFVHHLIAIGEFKLELQPGNALFGSNSTIFLGVWPWNLTDDLEKKGTSSMLLQALCVICKPWVNSNWSFSPETPNLGQNRRFYEPRDREIWRMTLKNYRTVLLSNIFVNKRFVFRLKFHWNLFLRVNNPALV